MNFFNALAIYLTVQSVAMLGLGVMLLWASFRCGGMLSKALAALTELQAAQRHRGARNIFNETREGVGKDG